MVICKFPAVLTRSFDAAVPELVAAHLILALYWTHQMDSSWITRYMTLAHQSNGIICEPPGPLVAALTFVSVILYDAKVSKYLGRPGRVGGVASVLRNFTD